IFNSTGQATTPVTQTFEKYAPAGMKMIALPSRENFIRAYLGPVWIFRYAFMWLGPLDVFKKGGYSTFLENALIAPVLGGAAVLIVILILAIAVMFVPRRDA